MLTMNTNTISELSNVKIEIRTNSIEYEEFDNNTNSASMSQDESHRQNSFTETIINETLNNTDDIVNTTETTFMIKKIKPDKNAIIAESRIKAKQFDAEKLKPFFIEYKEEPREITDYDVCSNFLLLIFVLLGLVLVFLCGLGVAVSNIF